jgi:hypothetical protein
MLEIGHERVLLKYLSTPNANNNSNPRAMIL